MTGVRAPELPVGLRWFNSPALSLAGLHGKLVLVDFWTYSCVNCVRTFPYLKAWHERYAKHGLVVIGVHTPEFEFEKDAGNVERALKEFGLSYPVVQDNDYQIWKSYSNSWWPRELLVDGAGQIVYDHVGEGGYEETERTIQLELEKLGVDRSAFAQVREEHAHAGSGICYPSTPETYLGSKRGDGLKNTGGEWSAAPEYVEHTGSSSGWDDYISIKFKGTEVNLVMESVIDKPIDVKVVLDGKPPNDVRGADVGPEEIIKVKRSRMYRIIKSKEGIEGELRLYVREPGLRAYVFTFSGCTD